MTKHKWFLLRIAVDMLSGSPIPPCLRIERAARLGTVKLRGVKPHFRSDIPVREAIKVKRTGLFKT